MVYIMAYEKTRDLVTNYTNISDSKTKAFIAGGIGSAVSQTVVIPADVVSQHIMVALAPGVSGKVSSDGLRSSYFKPLNLQQDKIGRYRLALAVAREVHRESGLKGFYRGYLAAMICYVPSGACWWTLYQFFTEFLHNLSATKDAPNILLHPIAGALCGASVSILTNPLDLLRVNVQVHRPSSYKSAVKYLWKEDHWQVFTKGLTARLTQSCLSSTLIVVGYEAVKRWSIDEKYRDKVKW